MHDVSFTNTKRRSQRIEMNVPVVVYKTRRKGVLQNTQTLVINAHGALVDLTDMMAPRQRLQVQNHESGEHLECRIGPPKVAVELTQSARSFWRIAFPPAEVPASKLPQLAAGTSTRARASEAGV
jgi:hypothetical protein